MATADDSGRAGGLAGALGLALALAACGGVEPPLRDCVARVWSTAPEAHVLGSWDGWAPPGTPVEPFGDGWYLARLELPPGEHGYLVSDASGVHPDPLDPLGTWRTDGSGEEVSLLVVADCSVPELLVTAVAVSADALGLVAELRASASGAPLDAASVVVTTPGGVGAPVVSGAPESGRVEVALSGLPAGRVSVHLGAADEDGLRAEARALGWTAPATGTPGERDLRDEVLYQVLIDRFRGDGGAALDPPPTPGSRAGGTLGGVAAAVDDGSLAALGVTALWLSPVLPGPLGTRLGPDGHLYEGYHGYWPTESRGVEPRLGGEAALDALVARAHAAGLAVHLDLVPNHVEAESARYLEHPEWFSPSGCVCGSASCPWSSHIETCWFTPFLPDVRFQEPGAMAATLGDVRYFLERFDVDGYRIDAVPMMPRAATRRIADATRRAAAPARARRLLGEIYTGPGTAAVEALAYQLGPDGLDSAFDFPLMWALHDAVARGTGSFGAVEAVLAYEETRLAGSGAVMARMLDNHDTPRFVSVATGDDAADAWSSPAPQPASPEPYERLAVAMAIVFTLPGVPVLYQGDELGLAGGADPDNRRVLPRASELLPAQQALGATVGRLARLRRCSAALRRGARTPLVAAGDHYAYRRDGDYPVVVAVSASDAPVSFTLPPSAVGPGAWRDVVTGASVVANTDPTPVELAPRSFRILVRSDDPCGAAF
ncbi:MAG: hypothetical protein HY908_01070 [Myxococcales bacterium]|nr:hypothetical protein [Myxococcales bacterium]